MLLKRMVQFRTIRVGEEFWKADNEGRWHIYKKISSGTAANYEGKIILFTKKTLATRYMIPPTT